MPTLEISLFGPPSLRLDGQPVHARTAKAIPLLAYLLMNPGCHMRSTLATLLWSDAKRPRAFASLRTTTWRLKDAGLGPWLDVQHEQVGFREGSPVRLDVHQFFGYLDECRRHGHPPQAVCTDCLPLLGAAAELYRGNFMQGLSLRGAVVFDDWQTSQAELLRNQASGVLERLVSGYQKQNDLTQAIHYARQWLTIDRTNEETHRQLMTLYASTGQRQSALNQYQECVRLLKAGGVSPQAETTSIYQQILGGPWRSAASADSAPRLKSPIILCADVENSAALWDQYSQEMAKIYEKVAASIKDFARQYGGRVLSLTDDYFIMFFESGSPLLAAIALQKNARRPTEKKLAPLKARVAIHAADSLKPSIDSNASSIHFAKRLLSAGRGGQVLLSAPASEALDLPINARLYDHGFNILKDLGEPIHILGLQHPDLLGEQRLSLQSLATYYHNLPTFATPFIGREEELADLAQLLSQENCRLLTLTGPGGIGKTRLAVQSAAQLIERFPDGVAFISLSTTPNSSQILSTLAEVLRFNFYQPEDPARQLQDFLRSRHMLLIMDNFEHLVDGSALLSDLLNHAPWLKILVTSRECLHLPEECLYDVRAMGIPPISGASELENYSAVKLFLQNARRVHPGFHPSETDWHSIAEICQRVEGLPMALELASGWVRTLTCAEISEQISKQSFEFLDGTRSDRPVRRRTLRAAFDYSWNLLSEEGRRTLRRLSVFRGGFSLEAAQAVAATTPAQLAGMVDRSLLRYTSGRYEINEALRHFAHQKLEEAPEDYTSTERLHCEYYSYRFIEQANKLLSRSHMQAMQEIFVDTENLRTANDCALEHKCWDLIGMGINASFVFLELSGRAKEGYESFKRMLDVALVEPEAMESKWFPWLVMATGWFAFQIGQHTEGLEDLNKSLEILRTRGDEEGTAYNLALLASYYLSLSSFEDAGRCLEESLAIYSRISLPNERLSQARQQFTLYTAGQYYLQTQQYALAEQHAQAALSSSEQMGARWGEGRILNLLAQIAMFQRKLPQAESIWRQAQQIANEMGDRRGIASIYSGLGQVYEWQGQIEKAIETELLVLQIYRQLGDDRLSAVAMNNLAYFCLLLKEPDYPQATQYYRDSLDLFRLIQDQHGLLFTNYDLGQAYVKIGNLYQALTCHQQALSLAQGLGAPNLMLYVLHGFASLAAQRGETERALELCGLLLTHPQTQDDTRQRTQSLLEELNAAANPDLAQAAFQRGQALQLEPTVAEFLG